MLTAASFDSAFARFASKGEDKGVDVEALNADKRLGAWRDALYDTYYPLDLTSPSTAFRYAQLQANYAGEVVVGWIRSDPMVVHRRRKHVSRKSGDYILMPIPVDNTLTLSQHGRDAKLVPGDLAFVNASDAYTYNQGSRGRLVSLRIPAALLRQRFPHVENISAVRFHRNQTAVALFMDYAHSYCINTPNMDKATAQTATNYLMELLTFAITSEKEGYPVTDTSAKIGHCQRAIRYIEAHLDDPQLSVNQVASAVNVSERYLQRLFAERDETVTGFIRKRRLNEAKTMLADPASRPMSISTICYRVGFSDPSHFSRLFRDTEGVSPREFRSSNIVSRSETR